MRPLAAALACIVVLVAAQGAEAAQRYATPDGGGPEPCAQGAPCSLKDALGNAKSNDEVIVAPGSYILTEGIDPEFGVDDLDVHGVAGQPAPRISGDVNGYLIVARGTVSHLDLVNSSPEHPAAIVCVSGGRLERIRATARGSGAIAIYQGDDCLVRDSLGLADGPESSGLYSGSYQGYEGVARNVTAIATGPGSVGVRAETTIIAGAQSHRLDLKNAIASGAEADLLAEANDTYQVAATITVSNSNFVSAIVQPKASILDAGGNQSAPPLFVDAAAGDYREAAGSPTIDAGSTDLIGSLDLDGNPRAIGVAPDVGAFEFVPTPAPPAPAGQILALRIGPPATFRAANFGGAIISRSKKATVPVTAVVEYELSAAAAVQFTVERKLLGRRAGKRCVKKTKANADKRRCPLFKVLKRSFAHSGVAGANSFRFSGRLAAALPPGAYRLTGRTGTSSKAAAFKIVK